MRVLVCGSRHFNDINFFAGMMNEHIPEEIRDDLIIISGEARGADTLAKDWAFRHGVPYAGFPADWKGLGKAAGPIRNKQMLDEGKPDKVIAFLQEGSKGTKNMIEQATKANIPVEIINI